MKSTWNTTTEPVDKPPSKNLKKYTNVYVLNVIPIYIIIKCKKIRNIHPPIMDPKTNDTLTFDRETRPASEYYYRKQGMHTTEPN